MFNVRLAGGHLYGKQLFTWLSLVVSLMASFVLFFFPLDVLDEIWDLIESVSEGFLTNSHIFPRTLKYCKPPQTTTNHPKIATNHRKPVKNISNHFLRYMFYTFDIVYLSAELFYGIENAIYAIDQSLILSSLNWP